jgi:hypothetical protein
MNDGVYMASDRYLTHPDPEKDQVDAVKNVLFFNDMVLGYTGMAQMLTDHGLWVDTATWLQSVLLQVRERSLAKAVEAIRVSTQRSIDRLVATHQFTDRCRIAFVGIGWERDPGFPFSVRSSLVALVSNFHHAGDEELLGATRLAAGSVSNSCVSNLERIPAELNAAALFQIGAVQSELEIDWLRKGLEKLSLGQVKPTQVLELMTKSIRQTSERYNRRFVGADIIAVAIPIGAAKVGRVEVTFPQSRMGVYFDDAPRNTKVPIKLSEASHFMRFSDGASDGSFVFPHIVAPGFKSAGFWTHPKNKTLFEFDFLNEDGIPIALAGLTTTNLKRREIRHKGKRSPK